MKKQLTFKKQTITNLTETTKGGKNQKILITPIMTITVGYTHDLTWW